jgi:chemotaxis family two-component system sensor kinase Cph1
MSDEALVGLDDCAQEPIHVPGAVQPHGVLFVLREPQLIILQVSENVGLFLGISPEGLLGLNSN